MSVALLVGTALLFGRRIDRVRVGLVVLVVFGLPAITDTLEANRYDYPTQGRYLMPLFAGAVLLSTEALVRSGVWDARRSRILTRAFAVGVMPLLHLICLVAAMVRWQSGASYDARRPHFNPFAGPWHPAAGSGLPLELAVIGLVVIGYVCWRAANPPAPPAPVAAETVELASAGATPAAP
jgi:hypothetical protein